MVGLTEAEAKQKGLKVKITQNDMTGWFSAKSHAAKASWSKFLVEEGSDKLIGAHFLGHHGEELVNLIAQP